MAQVLLTATNFAGGVLLARWLTVPARGEVALANVVTTIAVIAIVLGVPELQLSTGDRYGWDRRRILFATATWVAAVGGMLAILRAAHADGGATGAGALA